MFCHRPLSTPTPGTWAGLNITGKDMNQADANQAHNEVFPRAGVVPDIFNSLAEQLNFTYTLQFSRDGGWGSIDEVRFGLVT